jgi:hypothetical protein
MMKKQAVCGLIIIIILGQSGCATIVSGRTQDVMIRSNPSGAKVTIDEVVSGTTPMVANLLRKKRHQVAVNKEGYEEVVHATTRGFNWWYIVNIVLGGIIGLIIDPITGSIFEIEPAEVNMTLPKAEPTLEMSTAVPAAIPAEVNPLPQIQAKQTTVENEIAKPSAVTQTESAKDAVVTDTIEKQLLEPAEK